MVVTMSQVDTPALILDLGIVRSNIRKMAEFFEPLDANLRPHFKTHKCARLARMQVDAGAIGMTCAKVGEAEVLVSAGFRDVFIANQVVGPMKAARLMALLESGADVKVAVDSVENARELLRATTARNLELGVLVEVDVGLGRCGLPPNERVVEMAKFIDESPSLVFRGLMGYEGHAVLVPDAEERKQTALTALERLAHARKLVEDAGLEVEIVSAAGTGTYAFTGTFPGVTEVQAGSYATMDARYVGVCPEFRCGISVLTTVVSRSKPNVAVADAGLKSITGEFGLPPVKDRRDMKVTGLSEEHVTLQVDSPGASGLKVGERIELVPSHGCTTINLHDEFVVVENNREVDVWRVGARGKFK